MHPCHVAHRLCRNCLRRTPSVLHPYCGKCMKSGERRARTLQSRRGTLSGKTETMGIPYVKLFNVK